ncbi:hypothetical protein AVDCRST_MAG94-812, partial [uncultured Leptolyngbya sp.]
KDMGRIAAYVMKNADKYMGASH